MQAKPRFFSRFFPDIRHRPKHCDSLLVQTGFPTSLIDIFVKNQDRLKNPSKCKKSKKISTPPRAAAGKNTNQHVSAVDFTPPTPFCPVSSEIRVPEIVDSASGTCAPACRRSEFADFDSEIPSVASEIRIPGGGESEIAALASETRVPKCGGSEITIPICRNSSRGGGSSMRRLFEMVIFLSIVAISLLTTKRIAIGIAITAFVLSFLRSLQWRASCRRLLTPTIANLAGEEARVQEINSVLPPVEDVNKIENRGAAKIIPGEGCSRQQEEITEIKEAAGGRGRRRRLKSKLMKLVHRKPKTWEKLKNTGDQESIGEDGEEAIKNEDVLKEESSSVSTEVISDRENDYTGCLIALSVVLGGLCFGHTAAMAITIIWFVNIKWWMFFISRCKRR